MITLTICFVFMIVQTFVMYKFVLPPLAEKLFQERVTDYVVRAVNEVQEKTRARFDAIEATISGNNKKIAEVFLGYKKVIEEMQADLDDLYSAGQAEKAIEFNDDQPIRMQAGKVQTVLLAEQQPSPKL